MALRDQFYTLPEQKVIKAVPHLKRYFLADLNGTVKKETIFEFKGKGKLIAADLGGTFESVGSNRNGNNVAPTVKIRLIVDGDLILETIQTEIVNRGKIIGRISSGAIFYSEMVKAGSLFEGAEKLGFEKPIQIMQEAKVEITHSANIYTYYTHKDHFSISSSGMEERPIGIIILPEE